MQLLDLMLNDLNNAVDAFKPPTLPLAQANNTARILSCIKLKICSAHKSTESKIGLVPNAQKEVNAFSFLPKIEANLQVLEDVLAITNKDLDIICNQVVSNELSEGETATLLDEVTNLIDTSCATVVTLQAKLL